MRQAMGDEADRLRAILMRFAQDPDDATLWGEARQLADRFTMDQLCAMAAPRAGEVGRLFDRILGRTRRDDSGVRRAVGLGRVAPQWENAATRGVAGGTR